MDDADLLYLRPEQPIAASARRHRQPPGIDLQTGRIERGAQQPHRQDTPDKRESGSDQQETAGSRGERGQRIDGEGHRDKAEPGTNERGDDKVSARGRENNGLRG